MKILYAASEVAPFAKTGGLADVLGALPQAVARQGHDIAVIMPLYGSVRRADPSLKRTRHVVHVPVGTQHLTGRLWQSSLPRSQVPIYFIEHADYFERDDPESGRGIYQFRLPSDRLQDYPDNCQRFVFFSRAVLEAIPLLEWTPNIVHANDWQTGLIPVYLREMYRKKKSYSELRSVFTIHNQAYQGIFWHWDMTLTGLDWSLFNYRQLEFFGHLNFLKAGVVFADAVTTVSPRYAEEIQTRELGCGLDGVMRSFKDKLSGIVNGADYSIWDPASDSHLATPFDVESVVAGKAKCKEALQTRVGLPVRSKVPLLGMITRLAEQKGIALFRDAARDLLSEDIQFVVLGVGEASYQKMLEQLKYDHPQQVAVVMEFNERLAHQIEAGADMFLMPSRYEPSGLNQLYSMKYGTVPIVRDTGGLHDTVTDYPGSDAAMPTGFLFKEYTPAAFRSAIRRALDVYRRQPDQWLRLVKAGMMQDWSWDRSAADYVRIYERLLK